MLITRSLVEIELMVRGNGLQQKDHGTVIRGVSIDSRTLQPGNLFIPIARKLDGHDYAEEAVQKGASALLWQTDRPNPPRNAPVIFVEDTFTALQRLAAAYRNELPVQVVGVTGSNGKTTTKDMITSILSTTYKVHKSEGNLNNYYGLPLTLLLMDEDCEIAVLEMGMSKRGEIELLASICKPNIAVITVIGESHLRDLGSRDQIAEAKLEIVSGLEAKGTLIYNGDEPLLEQALKSGTKPASVQCLRFGQHMDNDYFPLSVRLEKDGTYFTYNKHNSCEYMIPLLGKHYVSNALAALAVAEQLGVSEENARAGLRQVKVTGMRMEVSTANNGLTVINDAFNASPTSMKAAIQMFYELQGYKHKILILGDMLELGDEEKNYHHAIGAFIDPAHVDYVYTYGTLGAEFASAAKRRFSAGKVESFYNKSAIAEKIAAVAGPNDVVLVKGSRGMMLEELVSMLVDDGT